MLLPMAHKATKPHDNMSGGLISIRHRFLGDTIFNTNAIVGRYERGEMTPSIKVATKLAHAFGVTVDYLVSQEGQPAVVQDVSMLERIHADNELPQDDRERLLYVVDGLLRDACSRRACAIA